MTEPTTDLVTAAADLGRRDTERDLSSYHLADDSALAVTRLRDDERIEVTDLEYLLPDPKQPRGDVSLHDPDDFARYVLRLAWLARTTVWADINTGKVVAVLDDHADYYEAGWREHRVSLDLQRDPDWDAWIALDGKLVTQADFAEFIEQRMHTFVNPKAADLYEVATTLQASRNVTFRSGVRTTTGDVQLQYDEETTASAGKKGQLEIPTEFVVKLAPFAFTEPVELVAKLRYRIDRGDLRIGYVLIQPDQVKRNAFDTLVGHLRGALASDDGNVPVFLGAAPRPLRNR